MDMDINCNVIRGRSALSSRIGLRNLSVLFITLLVLYYKHMELNNDLLDDNVWDPIDISQLSYKENVEIDESIYKVNDKNLSKRGQHVLNEALALNTIPTP